MPCIVRIWQSSKSYHLLKASVKKVYFSQSALFSMSLHCKTGKFIFFQMRINQILLTWQAPLWNCPDMQMTLSATSLPQIASHSAFATSVTSASWRMSGNGSAAKRNFSKGRYTYCFLEQTPYFIIFFLNYFTYTEQH